MVQYILTNDNKNIHDSFNLNENKATNPEIIYINQNICKGSIKRDIKLTHAQHL